MSRRSTACRLAGLFSPEWLVLGAALILCACGAALSVVGPLLLGRATDLVITGVRHGSGRFDFTTLDRLLLVVLAVYAGAALFNMLGVRLAILAVERTVFRLRERLQAKLTRLPLRILDQYPPGELLSRATNDLDTVSRTGHQAIGQIVNSLVTVTGVLAAMFWLSPLLALLTLVLVPVSALVVRPISRRIRLQFAKQAAAAGAVTAHVEEMYTGHALVRTFDLRHDAAETFRRRNAELREANARGELLAGLIEPLMAFLSNFSYLVIAVVGGLRVASGALTVGDVQAVVQYSRQFSQPITQLASLAGMLQTGLASGERILELLDAEEERPDSPAPARLAAGRGAVAFENVSFRYAPDQPLIDGLSMDIRPGRTVALVGSTGAGKTTLVNLLLRFHEPTGGRITLDGVDIATLTRADLRSRIGLVLQDVWLFHGTIEENIAYGRPGATMHQVEAAARAAHADHFIRTLPEGYRTVVGESGLSAGERQLITIARAFLADPSVLVLDEATSSVDGHTEVLVRQGLADLRNGRTIFMIAHRLSTIRTADTILFLKNGAIAEQGTHSELLATDGAYARLQEIAPGGRE